jgi:hypothetical protein
MHFPCSYENTSASFWHNIPIPYFPKITDMVPGLLAPEVVNDLGLGMYPQLTARNTLFLEPYLHLASGSSFQFIGRDMPKQVLEKSALLDSKCFQHKEMINVTYPELTITQYIYSI